MSIGKFPLSRLRNKPSGSGLVCKTFRSSHDRVRTQRQKYTGSPVEGHQLTVRLPVASKTGVREEATNSKTLWCLGKKHNFVPVI